MVSGHYVSTAFLCLSLSAFAGSPPKGDRSWKNYYNQQGSYCVDYPSHWVSGDAFEGGGFFLIPVANPRSKSLAEIDVSVLEGRRAGSNLVDEVLSHLDDLKKFGLAESLRVLERHDAMLSGSPALFASDTYDDPQSGAAMVDEIVFAARAGMLYRLELTSGAGQLARFDPVFQHLVSSFRFDCPPHPIPRDFGTSRARDERPAIITRPVAVSHPVAN
jgi:hypothetical protein